jgi:Na+-driven multidrug efflux pump
MAIFGASAGIAWEFTDDPEIQALIKQYFWIIPFGFGFHGISQLISASFNTLHQAFHSTTINIIRLFFILIPMV